MISLVMVKIDGKGFELGLDCKVYVIDVDVHDAKVRVHARAEYE